MFNDEYISKKYSYKPYLISFQKYYTTVMATLWFLYHDSTYLFF